jgi:hypothetical protein
MKDSKNHDENLRFFASSFMETVVPDKALEITGTSGSLILIFDCFFKEPKPVGSLKYVKNRK